MCFSRFQISANTFAHAAHWKRLQQRMSFLHCVNILGASLGFNNCKHVFTCCTLKQRMCMPDRLEHNCILHIVKFSKKQNKTKEIWWFSSYESYQCVLTDVFCFEVQTCKYHNYHKMQPKLLDSGDFMKACNICCQHFLCQVFKCSSVQESKFKCESCKFETNSEAELKSHISKKHKKWLKLMTMVFQRNIVCLKRFLQIAKIWKRTWEPIHTKNSDCYRFFELLSLPLSLLSKITIVIDSCKIKMNWFI